MQLIPFRLTPIPLFVLAFLGFWLCIYFESNKEEYYQVELGKIETRLISSVENLDDELSYAKTDLYRNTWADFRFPVFYIENNQIKKWSEHDFVPDLRALNTDESLTLIQNNSGDFLYKRIIMSDTSYILGVICLSRKYPITNRYLNSKLNYLIFKSIEGRVENLNSSSEHEVRLTGEAVFKFYFTSARNTYRSFFTLVIASISFSILIVAIIKWLLQFHQKRKYEVVFLISLTTFAVIRYLMLYFEFPNRWINTSLFDPQIFASSSFNASIGDLLLNSLGVLFLSLYVFYHYPKFGLTRLLLGIKTNAARYFYLTGLILLGYFSLVFPFLFVEIIFHNSLISLDITESLRMDAVRLFSWISIIAGSISAFLFIHLSIKLAKKISKSLLELFLMNFAAGVIFCVYFLFAERDYWITLVVGFILFTALIIFKLTKTVSRIQFDSFVYLFVVLSALGIQYGLSIRLFSEERFLEVNKKYAANFIVGRDILGEFLLHESGRRIQSDTYIQNSFNNPFVNRSLIKEKIRQVYLNSYFDRYEIKTSFHSSRGETYDSAVLMIVSNLLELDAQKLIKTEYEGIFFIKPVGSQANKQYLSVIPIYRFGLISGYVIVELNLKRVIPDNVYPELLVDNRFAQNYNYQQNSYAFISNGRIQNSYGDIDYQSNFEITNLDNPEIFEKGIKSGNYLHAAISEEQQVILISSPRYSLFNFLTNFSLFFVAGLLIAMFILSLALIISTFQGVKLNYAARIQLIIFILFSLPLTIAAVTTISRVSESAEYELTEEFKDKSQKLGEEVSPFLQDYKSGLINRSDLESSVSQLSKHGNIDITIYDQDGRYLASSQPMIYENQLISGLVDVHVTDLFIKENPETIVKKSVIGNLQFNNCYQSLFDAESKKLLGILSVPFFNSESSLEETKINVLSNFLTIFTIVFILFSILSFYIIRWLTFPLQFITKALGKTTLTGENKPLKWNSSDEIGIMVSEYNRMVSNLEQSKIELARIQKESAWREIARQVAHEIKNPLTPMKLTLQQMEYRLNKNALDNEGLKKSISSVLAQIEVLNEIASSFSSFARMPAPIMQRIDLIKVLKDCANLYSQSAYGTVSFNFDEQALFIKGDELLLLRIFSNLILNGLQSGTSNVKVIVSISKSEDSVVVSVKDNGAGIDKDMAGKIFLPYFSTKKSGSGLGLAISKQGIEQSGGEIWFESEPMHGTTFYVKFPLES